jgi:hypothetical protein
MNSLRSAWTPLPAGLKIPICSRREILKLNLVPGCPASYTLSVGLVQNIGQVTQFKAGVEHRVFEDQHVSGDRGD